MAKPKISTNPILSAQIKEIRKRRGKTQADLAEKIDLSPTEISNIERGKNSISFNTLVNLCRELDVCPCQLLSGAIKDTVEENIIDLVHELNQNEREILYKLLVTYVDNQNWK